MTTEDRTPEHHTFFLGISKDDWSINVFVDHFAATYLNTLFFQQESRLPSIVETKGSGISDDSFHLSPTARSRRNLLLPNFTSPVRRTSLGNLLGDELRQFNALRRCRSPNLSRGFLGQSPQPPSKKEHSNSGSASNLSKGQSEPEQKPSKLLIPTLTCSAPPDLSPRCCELSFIITLIDFLFIIST